MRCCKVAAYRESRLAEVTSLNLWSRHVDCCVMAGCWPTIVGTYIYAGPWDFDSIHVEISHIT